MTGDSVTGKIVMRPEDLFYKLTSSLKTYFNEEEA